MYLLSEEFTMNPSSQVNENDYSNRNCRNTQHLRNWTIAWVISMAIAAFAPKYIWNFNTLLSFIAIVTNIAVGFGMLLANRKYLQGLDEMQRKILFDAMALSLGVGLVLGSSYELLEDIKLIPFQPEISHLVIIMCLTYVIGVALGHRKYQ